MTAARPRRPSAGRAGRTGDLLVEARGQSRPSRRPESRTPRPADRCPAVSNSRGSRLVDEVESRSASGRSPRACSWRACCTQSGEPGASGTGKGEETTYQVGPGCRAPPGRPSSRRGRCTIRQQVAGPSSRPVRADLGRALVRNRTQKRRCRRGRNGPRRWPIRRRWP